MRRLAAALLVASFASTAAGQARAPRPPQVWAVVVGVGDYVDPAIPDCPGAVRDARSLAAWFADGAGWGAANVLVLRDGGNPTHGRAADRSGDLAPSRINLNWAVKEWVPQRVKPGDLVVIYFAGQAASTAARDVFLPPEARADGLERTGWSPEDAIDDLVLRSGCAVACLLDTSPQGRGRPVPGSANEPGAGSRLVNRLSRWPGVSAWLAADGRPAGVDADGRSPFAAALLAQGKRPASSLSAWLDALSKDRALAAQGFRARGGVAPGLAFWPQSLLPPGLGKPELVLQRGHADRVTSVRLSADGERMITASMDSTVRIWRVTDGERVLLRVLADHRVGVTALGLDPGGRLLASGDGTGRVRAWDLVENRPRLSNGRSPHSGRIEAIAFLPDGRRFAALDQSGRCVLWDGKGPLLSASILKDAGVQILSGDASGGAVGLAIASDDGTITLLDGDAKPLGVLGAPSSRPTALDLGYSGGLVALGNNGGRVEVWDTASRKSLRRLELGRPVSALKLGPDGLLAIGDGEVLTLVSAVDDAPSRPLPGLSGEVTSALFSADGRWLSAATKAGDFGLWDLSDRANPRLVLPIKGSEPPDVACLALSADGRRLAAGQGSGGVLRWDLPDARERPRIAERRANVAALNLSSDGRCLLQISGDGIAQVWDLEDGRGPRALDGHHASGAFLAGSDRIVLARDGDDGGGLVLVDRSGAPIPTVAFAPPPAADGNGPSLADFARVAASPDGRRVAASTARGREEIVCVWDASGGAPVVLKGHDRVITDIGFSRDGQSLLTAGEDGAILLWDLASAKPTPLRSADSDAVTAARLDPSGASRAVSAHWSPDGPGRVVLWEWDRADGPKAAKSRRLGELDDRVLAVAFSADGRYVAAAGDDRRVRIWEITPGKTPRGVELDREHPENQHAERVNALVAWPDRPQFASGGDDTAVKLWGIDAGRGEGTLLGTLSAAPAVGGEPGDVDWVAFTPAGVYDASNAGDRAVAFVVDREIRPLDQFAERLHRFRLTNDLRGGQSPAPAAHSPPPPLAIDPPAEPETEKTTARLRISVPDPTLKVSELRLYHNGVPARVGAEDFRADGPGSFVVEVALRSGLNRFYAMAGRPGDVDARTRDVDVKCTAPEPGARTHVVAIGVGAYNKNALRFAVDDAGQLSDYLHKNSPASDGTAGSKRVLADLQVSEESVDEVFSTLRKAVKGRPQDTVVVFLAGHTGVLPDRIGRPRFSLLLPNFPFPKDAPAIAGVRGVDAAGSATKGPPEGTYLTYSTIEKSMLRLDPLRRLVIVDACQAAAILDDAGVLDVRRALDAESRRAKSSYFLAARRGESAGESPVLKHGLLTYALLRGLEAPDLERPFPADIDSAVAAGADSDGNGVVTTAELHAYVDRALPALAAAFPDLPRRDDGQRGASGPSQGLRIQVGESSFPVAKVPKKPAR